MEPERIELSQRERDRLKVLQEVERGHVKQVEASQRLRLSDRQVRRLLGRVRKEGDRGVIHRLRGRPSNRKSPAKFEQRVLARVRQRYADFGPTLAAEHLAQDGLRVSRETLRNWMAAAGLWRPRRLRVKTVHGWRERRASFGELVMWDSSPYAWLEERGPKCHLIAMIDDATSWLGGRFAAHDSTEENQRVLQGWLGRYGRPLAYYTDKDSLFVINRPPQLEEQLRGALALTQIGRALRELGIEWIPAHSPQAQGRTENAFGTLQDRLVKEMRLARVRTIEQPNGFLAEVFVPFWERGFAVVPRSPRDAHRALGREHRLEQILSMRVPRTVANDYTVRWEGQRWGVPRSEGGKGFAQLQELGLDGGRSLVRLVIPGTGVFQQPGRAVLLETAQPFADGGHGGGEQARGGLDAALTGGFDQPEAMVVGVLHLTDQIEIASGGGHGAGILPAPRRPAPPPSAGRPVLPSASG